MPGPRPRRVRSSARVRALRLRPPLQPSPSPSRPSSRRARAFLRSGSWWHGPAPRCPRRHHPRVRARCLTEGPGPRRRWTTPTSASDGHVDNGTGHGCFPALPLRHQAQQAGDGHELPSTRSQESSFRTLQGPVSSKSRAHPNGSRYTLGSLTINPQDFCRCEVFFGCARGEHRRPPALALLTWDYAPSHNHHIVLTESHKGGRR